MNDSQYPESELRNLIFALLNDNISQEDLDILKSKLREDEKSRRFYIEYLVVNMGLRHGSEMFMSTLPMNVTDDIIDPLAWNSLAEAERKAETVEVINVKEDNVDNAPRMLGQVVKGRREISRLSLYTAIISTAALVIILAYVIMRPRIVQPLVATLIDTVNAKWTDSSLPSIAGSDMRTGPRELLEGFAKIKFDDL